MRKNTFLFLAAAGCMLAASCTEDSLAPEEASRATADLPIGFDTYLSSNSGGVTRAESTPYSAGLFSAQHLKDNGFGVFAYMHKEANTFGKPDFMYNQQVTFESDAWTYSPLKYWPNETTDDSKTGNDAAAANITYVSFFAYAPYQTSVESKEYGITKILDTTTEGATAEGAPTITYKVNPDASKSEDLLWGTAPLSGLSYVAVNGSPIVASSGMPLVNLVKPETHTRLKFLFQHALTALRMDLSLAVDQLTAGGTLAEGTTIKVNSITLAPKASEPAQGFALEGKLSLNNTAANVPAWTATDGSALTAGTTVTIGGTDHINMNDALAAITKESPLPLTVLGASATDALMLIPVYTTPADFDVTLTIDYDIVTADDHYGENGTVTINNKISKNVTLKAFKAGRLYNLHLVLGLTSVKIDAEAQDWTVDELTVDVPRNL